MAVTRINNNQITDAASGNVYVGVNATSKLQDYTVTSTKIANNLTYGSDLTITGNLTVNGQTTTIDTTVTTIEDPVIVLASNQTGSPTVDIGYIGERGTDDNIAFVWDESASEFVTVYTTDLITNTVVSIASYANFHTGNANIGGDITINGNTSIVGNVTSLNVTGNITGGNLLTPGVVSAAANVTGGNVTTAGQVVATANITGGNVLTGGIVSATSNVVGGNLTTAGEVVATANITGGNLNTAGTVSTSVLTASGNVTGGNVLTSGIVSATANITGGNVLTGGIVSATSDITSAANVVGGNLLTSGLISSTGNLTSGNVNTAGQVSATGNVTGGNLVTTGSLVAPSIDVAGNVSAGNLLTTGIVSATSNITGGNVLTAGLVSATGNVNGGNLISGDLVQGTTLSATANVVAGNLTTAGQVVATANITGGNLLTGGLISSTGNLTSGNIDTAGQVVATANITGGNLTTAGQVVATANITGGNLLTGGLISSTGDITSAANVVGGNINTGGLVSATGNIIGGNLVTTGSIVTTGNLAVGNLNATNGVYASTGYFTGNVDVLGNLNATIGVVYANSGIFLGDTVTGNNAAFAGIPGYTQLGSNVVMQFAGNVNSYSQLNFQNINAGNQASTDFIATADNGSDTTYYLDLGINSSTFDDPINYPGFGPNDSYVHNHGGNLILNPETTGTVIKLMVGGTDNSDVIATVSTTGIDVTGVVSATANVTGGNLTTAGQVVATANITGGNILTAGLVGAGTVSASGNIIGGNVITDNIVGGTTLLITATTIDLQPTGNITVSSRYINNLADPVQDQDAATKAYVDSVAQGLDVKASCYLATAAALPAYTYNNGSSGVGATITLNAAGNLTVDGTVVAANERILVKNETSTNAPYNGIYVVTTAGTPSVAAVLTRTTDFDNGNPSGEIPGAFTFIEHGSTQADTGWVCTTNNPVTVGTTPITFVQFSGAGSYSAGNALSLSGTEFNVNVDTSGNNTVGINGSNELYIPTGAVLTNPNITAATGTSLSVSGNVTGGNLNTGGQVVASGDISGNNLYGLGVVSTVGNVTGGNVLTGGIVSATGNITGGNVSGTLLTGTLTTAAQPNITSVGILSSLSVSGNVDGGNLRTAGLITATGNVTGGNIDTAGQVVATANITGGNLTTAGQVVATANITGGNILTGGLISATSTITSTANVVGGNLTTAGEVVATANITGGNLLTGGLISATGNIAGGNLYSAGTITSVGNVYAPYFIGNIAGNIDAGGANTEIQFNDNDILAGSPGFTFDKTSNLVTVLGNIQGGNLLTGGLISATANITGGNLLTGGLISSTGDITSAANVVGGNINTAGIVSATANVVGGNLTTAGQVVATANITGGNLLTAGLISSTGNLTSGNIDTAGQVVATANITGGNILTGGLISATSTITSSANIAGGNLTTAGQVSATGNITGDYLIANTGIIGNITVNDLNVGNVTANGFATITGNVTGGNLLTGGLVSATANITGGNISTAGQVVATANVTGGNLLTGGLVSATGNITGGNIIGVTSGQFGNVVISGDDITDVGGGKLTINNAGADVDFAVNGDTLANIFYVDAGTGTTSFGSSTQTTGAIAAFNTSDSILVPVGNTAQRPLAGTVGMLRFNTQNDGVEIYAATGWQPVGQIVFTVITDEQFNGDGVTVNFTLGANATTASTIVSINGVVQIPTTAYSVSGTTLTFTEAPQSGDVIDVRNLTTTTTVVQISNAGGTGVVETDPVFGQVNITGNLIPTANATYDLGNATLQWKDLHLSGNSIYLGDIVIKDVGSNQIGFFQADGTTPATIDSNNVDTTTISSGTSNVAVASSGGNVRVNIGGTSNVAVFSTAGANITGILGVTGNITGGNISATYVTASSSVDTPSITHTGSNAVGNIGSSTSYFDTLFATATSALYADLAEKYVADADYPAGTVVVFGGDKEVTVTSVDADRAVAGVVSTNPSYIMNGGLEAEFVSTVALTGRVPCRVTGTVRKGDLMVSAGYGLARAEADPRVGTVIGKALENFEGNEGVIEVVVGRF